MHNMLVEPAPARLGALLDAAQRFLHADACALQHRDCRGNLGHQDGDDSLDNNHSRHEAEAIERSVHLKRQEIDDPKCHLEGERQGDGESQRAKAKP